jgi:hypothetical protein
MRPTPAKPDILANKYFFCGGIKSYLSQQLNTRILRFVEVKLGIEATTLLHPATRCQFKHTFFNQTERKCPGSQEINEKNISIPSQTDGDNSTGRSGRFL